MPGDAQELRRWLDRLLPAACLVCCDPLVDGEGCVCGVCWSRAPRQRYPTCARCGISLPNIGLKHSTSTCIECETWLPYLRAARAPFRMAGTAAEIVHALKYGGWERLALEMALAMAEMRFGAVEWSEFDGVVAIPLSATRLRERGFNQAELLARAVAERRACRFLGDVLRRPRHTRRQARLPLVRRRANVRGAFRVPPAASAALADTHLLLVDDVLTTGATALDCVRALCEAGARTVSVLTFGRALYAGSLKNRQNR